MHIISQLEALAIFAVVRIRPEIADQLFLSSRGKLFSVGVVLASVVLPIVAAVRGSKWRLLAAAPAACLLVDVIVRPSRPMR